MVKLLIADDSSVIRRVIKAVAEVLKLETVEAQDGVEAMEILSSSHDDIGLVLLDWNMPEMNGFEVLTSIKSDETLKHIPVMMVTTEGEKSSIISAIRAGACNYLTKPFTTEELEIKLMECLGNEDNFS